MMRLTERYADYLQVGFLGFARYDGDLVNTAAIKGRTNSAT
jgi:HK97 family phage major capsid protein